MMAIGKETSNPLIFNDSPLTGVYTPGSDENSMKLKSIDVQVVLVAVKIRWIAYPMVKRLFK